MENLVTYFRQALEARTKEEKDERKRRRKEREEEEKTRKEQVLPGKRRKEG